MTYFGDEFLRHGLPPLAVAVLLIALIIVVSGWWIIPVVVVYAGLLGPAMR